MNMYCLHLRVHTVFRLSYQNSMIYFQEKAEAAYVGYANLPNQVFRKAVKKGFQFSLMVVGMSAYSEFLHVYSYLHWETVWEGVYMYMRMNMNMKLRILKKELTFHHVYQYTNLHWCNYLYNCMCILVLCLTWEAITIMV